MTYLTGKLNKYLIKIIDQYNTIDLDELLLNFPKVRSEIHLTPDDYSIDDLIIKSFILGFKGFYVNKNNIEYTRYLNSFISDRVEMIEHKKNNLNLYSYKKDKREIPYVDITRIYGKIVSVLIEHSTT